MFENYVIEIEENKILDLCIMKKLPMRNNARVLESIMTSSELMNINVNIHRKKVYAIVEGEEVYIKLVTIPRVNYNKIEDLIRCELLYYFKDIGSILYTYSILKESDVSFEIIVFCLNADKIDVLKKSLSDFTKVKGIYLIQFCVLNFIKKVVNEDDFNLAFYSKRSLYLLEVRSNVLKKNKVSKKVNTSKEFKIEIDSFINPRLSSYCSTMNTYFVNIEDKAWLNEFSQDKSFIDLGSFSEKDIIESFTINNR